MSYGVYIGKNLTSAGHAWLAGYGDEPSSHWLEVVPRCSHPAGATVTVGVDASAELPGCRSPIAQVAQTARHTLTWRAWCWSAPARPARAWS